MFQQTFLRTIKVVLKLSMMISKHIDHLYYFVKYYIELFIGYRQLFILFITGNSDHNVESYSKVQNSHDIDLFSIILKLLNKPYFI